MKLFWALVSLSMTSMGIVFVISGTTQFLNESMTTIESTTASLNDIYFPSVYICNINQVTKTSLTKMGIENDRENMEDLFWHYVKGQTKMYTNKTFEENELKTDLNVTHLESLMKIIGWDEEKTFVELVKQFCLLCKQYISIVAHFNEHTYIKPLRNKFLRQLFMALR